MSDTPVWVAVHLYDRYGTYLIGLTTVEKARQYNYYEHTQHKTMEQAESYVKLCLDRIEKQSKQAYENGHHMMPKPSRQAYSPFLREVFREALESIGYDGWVQVA